MDQWASQRVPSSQHWVPSQRVGQPSVVQSKQLGPHDCKANVLVHTLEPEHFANPVLQADTHCVPSQVHVVDVVEAGQGVHDGPQAAVSLATHGPPAEQA